jgi:hypothetical protein
MMTKILTALAVAASLGGCITTHDYCTESHPLSYRQRSAEWEANYRTCRMLEVGINQRTPRMAVDVYIR